MQTTFTTCFSTVLREHNIRIVAVLISFALSAWAVYSDGVVNRDGILYLEAAALLEQGQWSASLALYDWPLYSSLIALADHLTGLGLWASAQWLNAALFALLVYAFIGLAGELGGDRRTLIAAALVILLQPQLNEYRADILRDTGYWAFYLLSIWLFVKYYKMPQLRYAWAWGVSIIIAMLFRIEGMAFLFLLPLTLLLKHDVVLSARLRALAGAYLVGLAGLVLLLAWWVIDPDALMRNIGRLDEPFNRLSELWGNTSSHLQEQAVRLNQAILNQFSESHALHAVVATLVTLLVLGVLSALSLVYALLILHSFISGTFRTRLSADMQRVIVWLVAINLVVLSVFLVKMFFLTGRYPIPVALTLMLILPFHLVYLTDKWRMSEIRPIVRKLYLVLIVFVISAVVMDSLVTFGPSKQHIKAAGLWLANETPAKTRFYTNDGVVAYYAGNWQPIDYDDFDETLTQLRSGAGRNFDYVAIRVKKRGKTLEAVARQVIGHDPVKVFKNKHGEKVLIFQTQVLPDNAHPLK